MRALPNTADTHRAEYRSTSPSGTPTAISVQVNGGEIRTVSSLGHEPYQSIPLMKFYLKTGAALVREANSPPLIHHWGATTAA